MVLPVLSSDDYLTDEDNDTYEHNYHQRHNFFTPGAVVTILATVVGVIFLLVANTSHDDISLTILARNTDFSEESVHRNNETPRENSLSLKKDLQPNIVFILADDLGYNSLNSDVSPFLVKLKDKGITLTNYYTHEICAPAR